VDREQESALYDALQRKARGEIAQIMSTTAANGGAGAMIQVLAELNGDESVFAAARAALAGAASQVHTALDRLERTAEVVRARFPDTPLHVDLAELRGYRYHTGLVFAALVPGHGQEVARGGRYDEIGSAFGHARPATGFSTDLKSLLSLAGAGAEPRDSLAIRAPWSSDPALIALVKALRGQGERVVYELPGEHGGAGRRLCKRGGNWQVAETGK
jgi:ATP phosphoribosyltransferase regulatory subunit